jgi:hypothetical protein
MLFILKTTRKAGGVTPDALALEPLRWGYLSVWERLPAAINDGDTLLLRHSRLEAAPTG